MSQAKDDSRNNRLTFSNMAEHTIRKELNEIALKSCSDATKAFGECAKSNGLMVVINCRSLNNSMNECLNKYTNPKAFDEYKAKRALEIEKK